MLTMNQPAEDVHSRGDGLSSPCRGASLFSFVQKNHAPNRDSTLDNHKHRMIGLHLDERCLRIAPHRFIYARNFEVVLCSTRTMIFHAPISNSWPAETPWLPSLPGWATTPISAWFKM